MVMGLAGRRIDAPGTEDPVFPLENAVRVQERVRHLLLEKDVHILVCSAACGADLVALQAAEALGIRRRIVLPFDPGRFRSSSVIDRPGDWGPIYDRIVFAAASAGDLVDLQLAEGEQAYAATNVAIVKETLRLSDASGDCAAVALVWNGIRKDEEDNSGSLGEAARERGLPVFNVSTLWRS
jgi:hypothetical protein